MSQASHRLLVILLGLVLYVPLNAAAQSANTLRQELRVFDSAIAAQCSAVKEQAAASNFADDPLTAFTLKDAVQSLCVCMPSQKQALMATLTEQDLAGRVTEVEFMALLKPYAIDKCAGEQIRNMYGEQCRERFRKSDLDVASYCACMNKTVSGYSNAVTAAIAAAASDYLPRAAEAEKNGAPVPARPPILEAYFQADQACKGTQAATDAAKP